MSRTLKRLLSKWRTAPCDKHIKHFVQQLSTAHSAPSTHKREESRIQTFIIAVYTQGNMKENSLLSLLGTDLRNLRSKCVIILASNPFVELLFPSILNISRELLTSFCDATCYLSCQLSCNKKGGKHWLPDIDGLQLTSA